MILLQLTGHPFGPSAPYAIKTGLFNWSEGVADWIVSNGEGVVSLGIGLSFTTIGVGNLGHHSSPTSLFDSSYDFNDCKEHCKTDAEFKAMIVKLILSKKGWRDFKHPITPAKQNRGGKIKAAFKPIAK